MLDGTPYYRLGGVRKVSADVRVVAASNQDLGAGVAAGQFRADLYHRLSQFTLWVPPLRERVEDIVPLARHFLALQNPELRFSPVAERALQTCSWPGNIRELRNVVVRASLMAGSDEIGPEILPRGPRAADSAPALNLDGMERRMILAALASSGGHQQKAAEQLGISRRTLARKLKTYGAESAAF